MPDGQKPEYAAKRLKVAILIRFAIGGVLLGSGVNGFLFIPARGDLPLSGKGIAVIVTLLGLIYIANGLTLSHPLLGRKAGIFGIGPRIAGSPLFHVLLGLALALGGIHVAVAGSLPAFSEFQAAGPLWQGAGLIFAVIGGVIVRRAAILWVNALRKQAT